MVVFPNSISLVVPDVVLPAVVAGVMLHDELAVQHILDQTAVAGRYSRPDPGPQIAVLAVVDVVGPPPVGRGIGGSGGDGDPEPRRQRHQHHSHRGPQETTPQRILLFASDVTVPTISPTRDPDKAAPPATLTSRCHHLHPPSAHRPVNATA